MRTTTAAALTGTLLLAALVACGTTPEPDTAIPSATASSTPTLSAEQQLQQCTDAVYEVDAAARKAGTDPDDRVMPDPCVGLSADEYGDVIFAVNAQLNQDARDELQDQIDEAAEQDQ